MDFVLVTVSSGKFSPGLSHQIERQFPGEYLNHARAVLKWLETPWSSFKNQVWLSHQIERQFPGEYLNHARAVLKWLETAWSSFKDQVSGSSMDFGLVTVSSGEFSPGLSHQLEREFPREYLNHARAVLKWLETAWSSFKNQVWLSRQLEREFPGEYLNHARAVLKWLETAWSSFKNPVWLSHQLERHFPGEYLNHARAVLKWLETAWSSFKDQVWLSHQLEREFPGEYLNHARAVLKWLDTAWSSFKDQVSGSSMDFVLVTVSSGKFSPGLSHQLEREFPGEYLNHARAVLKWLDTAWSSFKDQVWLSRQLEREFPGEYLNHARAVLKWLEAAWSSFKDQVSGSSMDFVLVTVSSGKFAPGLSRQLEREFPGEYLNHARAVLKWLETAWSSFKNQVWLSHQLEREFPGEYLNHARAVLKWLETAWSSFKDQVSGSSMDFVLVTVSSGKFSPGLSHQLEREFPGEYLNHARAVLKWLDTAWSSFKDQVWLSHQLEREFPGEYLNHARAVLKWLETAWSSFKDQVSGSSMDFVLVTVSSGKFSPGLSRQLEREFPGEYLNHARAVLKWLETAWSSFKDQVSGSSMDFVLVTVSSGKFSPGLSRQLEREFPGEYLNHARAVLKWLEAAWSSFKDQVSGSSMDFVLVTVSSGKFAPGLSRQLEREFPGEYLNHARAVLKWLETAWSSFKNQVWLSRQLEREFPGEYLNHARAVLKWLEAAWSSFKDQVSGSSMDFVLVTVSSGKFAPGLSRQLEREFPGEYLNHARAVLKWLETAWSSFKNQVWLSHQLEREFPGEYLNHARAVLKWLETAWSSFKDQVSGSSMDFVLVTVSSGKFSPGLSHQLEREFPGEYLNHARAVLKWLDTAWSSFKDQVWLSHQLEREFPGEYLNHARAVLKWLETAWSSFKDEVFSSGKFSPGLSRQLEREFPGEYLNHARAVLKWLETAWSSFKDQVSGSSMDFVLVTVSSGKFSPGLSRQLEREFPGEYLNHARAVLKWLETAWSSFKDQVSGSSMDFVLVTVSSGKFAPGLSRQLEREFPGEYLNHARAVLKWLETAWSSSKNQVWLSRQLEREFPGEYLNHARAVLKWLEAAWSSFKDQVSGSSMDFVLVTVSSGKFAPGLSRQLEREFPGEYLNHARAVLKWLETAWSSFKNQVWLSHQLEREFPGEYLNHARAVLKWLEAAWSSFKDQVSGSSMDFVLVTVSSGKFAPGLSRQLEREFPGEYLNHARAVLKWLETAWSSFKNQVWLSHQLEREFPGEYLNHARAVLKWLETAWSSFKDQVSGSSMDFVLVTVSSGKFSPGLSHQLEREFPGEYLNHARAVLKWLDTAWSSFKDQVWLSHQLEREFPGEYLNHARAVLKWLETAWSSFKDQVSGSSMDFVLVTVSSGKFSPGLSHQLEREFPGEYLNHARAVLKWLETAWSSFKDQVSGSSMDFVLVTVSSGKFSPGLSHQLEREFPGEYLNHARAVLKWLDTAWSSFKDQVWLSHQLEREFPGEYLNHARAVLKWLETAWSSFKDQVSGSSMDFVLVTVSSGKFSPGLSRQLEREFPGEYLNHARAVLKWLETTWSSFKDQVSGSSMDFVLVTVSSGKFSPGLSRQLEREFPGEYLNHARAVLKWLDTAWSSFKDQVWLSHQLEREFPGEYLNHARAVLKWLETAWSSFKDQVSGSSMDFVLVTVSSGKLSPGLSHQLEREFPGEYLNHARAVLKWLETAWSSFKDQVSGSSMDFVLVTVSSGKFSPGLSHQLEREFPGEYLNHTRAVLKWLKTARSSFKHQVSGSSMDFVLVTVSSGKFSPGLSHQLEREFPGEYLNHARAVLKWLDTAWSSFKDQVWLSHQLEREFPGEYLNHARAVLKWLETAWSSFKDQVSGSSMDFVLVTVSSGKFSPGLSRQLEREFPGEYLNHARAVLKWLETAWSSFKDQVSGSSMDFVLVTVSSGKFSPGLSRQLEREFPGEYLNHARAVLKWLETAWSSFKDQVSGSSMDFVLVTVSSGKFSPGLSRQLEREFPGEYLNHARAVLKWLEAAWSSFKDQVWVNFTSEGSSPKGIFFGWCSQGGWDVPPYIGTLVWDVPLEQWDPEYGMPQPAAGGENFVGYPTCVTSSWPQNGLFQGS
ncbi:hypothetical protein C8R43DRAFT_949921 [Mycena crocata]|nr:hypothetical protein C8R43DRAFT_949921 [Mycena crocata]